MCFTTSEVFKPRRGNCRESCSRIPRKEGFSMMFCSGLPLSIRSTRLFRICVVKMQAMDIIITSWVIKLLKLWCQIARRGLSICPVYCRRGLEGLQRVARACLSFPCQYAGTGPECSASPLFGPGYWRALSNIIPLSIAGSWRCHRCVLSQQVVYVNAKRRKIFPVSGHISGKPRRRKWLHCNFDAVLLVELLDFSTHGAHVSKTSLASDTTRLNDRVCSICKCNRK